jgi:hypothetical protein
MAKKAALVLGIVFVIVGVLGFIPNPIVGEDAYFHTNIVHDIAHLLIGIVMVALAGSAPNGVMISFGVVYGLLAIMGYTMESPLLGLIEINGNDNWLHIAFAVVLLGLGFSLKKEPSSMTASATPAM